MSFISDKIWVAIPAMDELQWLPGCLNSLAMQDIKDFHVAVCVNQPERWWTQSGKKEICERNIDTLDWLNRNRENFPFRLAIIDRSSRGRGWPEGEGGAGDARRAAMNYALDNGVAGNYIVSSDADTRFDHGYLNDITSAFEANPQADALAAPYFHELTEDESINNAILRYEVFLRLMLMNLIRIGSPYAFTAIGSAMAFRSEAYRKAGGVPRKSSGEDFYLLQKIAKRGTVISYIPSKAYPAARLSSRVGFGTGPALAKLIQQDVNRYNLIHPDAFREVQKLYDLFPLLFYNDLNTPADDFLVQVFGTSGVWKPLRSNARSPRTFIKACHQKFDGLRTWQFVRQKVAYYEQEVSFRANIDLFLPGFFNADNGFSWKTASTANLAYLRSELFTKEMEMRKAYDKRI